MNQAMQVLTSTRTVDWFTPEWVIEMVREVFGEIDLDPASHPIPQEWIRAKQVHQLDLTRFNVDPTWDNKAYRREIKRYSLAEMRKQPLWAGKVFLNPPFDATPQWLTRLVADYRIAQGQMDAIALVNANVGYGWFTRLWTEWPVCVTHDCLKFVNADGTVGGKSKRGQAFAYLGPNVERFAKVFEPIGRIILPGQPIFKSASQVRREQRLSLDWLYPVRQGDDSRQVLIY